MRSAFARVTFTLLLACAACAHTPRSNGDRHERLRDVVQGPDGAIYLLTDDSNGKLLRVAPAN